MTSSEILNILLGGGLLALVVGVITLKATVRKANAEAERAKADAEKAKADAESVRITNTENATRILVVNIVKPLKEELNATREDLQATKKEMASTKREMVRLRRAVDAAKDCGHFDSCPVRYKLWGNSKGAEPTNRIDQEYRNIRHSVRNDTSDNEGDDSGEFCSNSDIDGQPP